MSVKLAVTGSVVAGLLAVGAMAAVATWAASPPVRQVQLVTPAAVETTVAPVVVPPTQAPVPVESTPAPAPVAPAPKKVAPVTAQPAPAPVVRATVSAPRAAGTYPDGSPFKYDGSGRLIQPDVPPAPGMYGNAPRSDTPLNAVPTPTPTP